MLSSWTSGALPVPALAVVVYVVPILSVNILHNWGRGPIKRLIKK